MDTGKQLKELRKQKGITQKVIADFLGIKVNSYSQYENGVRKPSLDVLRRVADFYNVLGADFLSDSDPDSDFHLIRLLLDEYFRLIWVTNEILAEYKKLVTFADDNAIFTNSHESLLFDLLEQYNQLVDVKSTLEIESNFPEIKDLMIKLKNRLSED
jgi:transcriptional regulator with XRE-family HTH domain